MQTKKTESAGTKERQGQRQPGQSKKKAPPRMKDQISQGGGPSAPDWNRAAGANPGMEHSGGWNADKSPGVQHPWLSKKNQPTATITKVTEVARKRPQGTEGQQRVKREEPATTSSS